MQTKSTLEGTVHSPANEIEQIELTIEKARGMVALRDELMKLNSNRAFKKIIMEGYLKEEAVRLTEIAGEIQHKDHRDEIFDAIKGISHFRQYMQTILRMGDMAEESIIEHEAALDSIRAEEDGEEDYIQ